jgi:putative hydrolase of the HAD superfamily
MIRWIVFDLDDTLYLEAEYVRSGFAACGEWLQEQLGVNGFSEHAWALHGAGERGNIFDHALSHLRPLANDNAALVQRLVGIYRAHRPAITLEAEVVEVLDHLSRDHRLAIISDGFLVAQRLKVEALKLSRWCDPVIFTDLWGRDAWKPNPRAFTEFCTRVECLPSESMYVGDNPTKDFIAPNRLGWLTVRYRRKNGLHAMSEKTGEQVAQQEISALKELLTLPEFLPSERDRRGGDT